GAPGPVFADFVEGALAYRRLHGGGRGQPVARAVGLKPGIYPKVLDATAGLGRDAFVLAALGCEVVMLERSPIIAALLDDALARAALESEVAPIVARMTLIQADARQWLAQGSDLVDRKSTRLNSSHVKISYAVFCLKKKKMDRD